ncbi:MAG: hypothetical protein AAB788_04320 [Patescibacteria group bacterium]
MINKTLSILFLLLLPTQLGKHFFFDFSYLSGVRVDYLAPTVYLLDVTVFLLAIVNLKIVFKFFRNKKVLISLFLLMINVLFSQLQIISFYWFIKIIEFLIVFSLAKKILTTLKERSILTALFISGLFELFISLMQLINKHSIQGIFYYFGERLLTLSTPGVAKASIQGIEFLRPYGTFSHPNSMAGFFLLLYFFVLIYKKFNRYLALKYLYLFVSSVLVFISFSKIAIACYLILNTYYLILNTKFNCKICKIARVITLFIISLIFLSATTDPLTVNKRIELMKNSITIIMRYPIQGVGLGSYLVEQVKFSSKFYLFFNQPVHNIFLLFFSELGLIIGGIIIVFYLFYLRKLIKWSPYLILVIVMTGFFDHYWLTLQQNFLLMGFVTGAILSRFLPVD